MDGLTVPAKVRAAGGATVSAGAVALLVAVQTLTGFGYTLRVVVLLGLLAVLGVATAWAGLGTTKARWTAARAGLGLSAILTLASLGWAIFSVAHGLVSLFALVLPLLASGACATNLLALGDCKRVAEARARLAAEGLNLGV